MTARVLIDAGNLTVGGGVQVGASFVDELTVLASDPSALRRWPWLRGIDVEVSRQVADNLTRTTGELPVVVVRRTWRDFFDRRLKRSTHAVCFTVFGPSYTPGRGARHLAGFADVTSLFPEGVPSSARRSRAKVAVRRRISRRLFGEVDRIVVEAPFVREELASRWGIAESRVAVVPNVLNSVFSAHLPQTPTGTKPGIPTFCFVSRGYPHKNHDVLGAAARILEERHHTRVQFTLTLTDDEWAAMSADTRRYSTNVGPVDVSALPAMYLDSYGAIFPSLLECFSVTPLEAVASGCPLVASDRAFVRDVVGDAAWYFEPSDPEDLASTLLELLADPVSRDRRRDAGLRLAASWPTARDRAVAYLDLIDEQLMALALGGGQSNEHASQE